MGARQSMSKLFFPENDQEHIAWLILNWVSTPEELEEALRKIRQQALKQLEEE